MGAHKRILVVDDEVDFAKLIKLFLESRGYAVDLAHNPDQAFDKLKAKPDLVLLDRTLRGENSVSDGLDICEAIRKNKDISNTPIIVISARGMLHEKTEGLYRGADDYLPKPFHKEELIARIEAIFRRSDRIKKEEEKEGEIIKELRNIIDNKLVTPYFQPIVSVSERKIVGLEFLSRPPRDSILSNPEILFRSALKYGMYYDLELVGWKKAVADWKAKYYPEKVFLNCSPYLIEFEGFKKEILVDEIGIDPNYTVMEMTERFAIKDYKLFLNNIHEMREMGFVIAVDDLGSGFASLETVVEVNPDYVKIDMALIRDIHMNKVKNSVVETIIGFTKKNNIKSIAEGIEIKEELEQLKNLGVDAVQGYFLAKPSPEIDLEKTLQTIH